MERKDEVLVDKLFKVSPISINVIDVQSRQLLFASNWASNHIGYSNEEFKDLSHNLFEKIVHPEDRQIQLNMYNTLLNTPSACYRECKIRILKKDGDYIHASVRISVLEEDKDKVPTTLLNTAVDITEIIELRERLNRETQKMEVISYKNSHELRGPVATILGLIQLIDYGGLDSAHAYEIITSLKTTVQKLDSVIREINEHTY